MSVVGNGRAASLQGVALVGACLRSESRRVRASRTLRWIAAAVCALSVGMAVVHRWVGANQFTDIRESMEVGVFAGVSVVPYIAAFMGCMDVTSEFSSHVSRALYGMMPHRWMPAVAKLSVVACSSGLLAFLALLSGWAGMSFGAGTADMHVGVGDAVRLSAGAVMASCMLGMVGVAVGFMAKRGDCGAALLMGVLIVVPVFTGLVARAGESYAWIASLLPMATANAFVDPLRSADPVNVVMVVIWMAVAVVVSIAALRRAEL